MSFSAGQPHHQPAGSDDESGTRAQTYRGLLASEAGIWLSLFRWITRRPRTKGAATTAFGYAAEITPILLAFTALAALEIPILPLLLPWPEVRYPLAILGASTVLWMLGLLASLRVHPHVVGDDGLELRSGHQLGLHIPWAEIASVQRKRSHCDRKYEVQYDDNGASLNLQKTSNLEVILRRPLTVRFIDTRATKVDSVRFYADAPSELVTAVTSRIEAPGGERSTGWTRTSRRGT